MALNRHVINILIDSVYYIGIAENHTWNITSSTTSYWSFSEIEISGHKLLTFQKKELATHKPFYRNWYLWEAYIIDMSTRLKPVRVRIFKWPRRISSECML